jgi:two-component system chemotaxis response regulator CheB
MSVRNLIVIGASTGGTRILGDLLRRLPPLPACIVIVQHMPKYINASVIRTWGRECPVCVRATQDGDALEEQLVLVAPSEVHCTFVNNSRIRLGEGADVNYYHVSFIISDRGVSV